MPWIVIFEAPRLVSSCASRNDARTRSSRSRFSRLADFGGSGKSGKILGPSLTRSSSAFFLASILGASSRSTSCATRSRKAASAPWPLASPAITEQTRNPTAAIL